MAPWGARRSAADGRDGGRPAAERGGPPRRRFSVSALLDGFFFVFAGLAALWLAWLAVHRVVRVRLVGHRVLPACFWLVLAYLVLPRLHRILTTIYVPDYFIGRARTSDGLLGDPVNLALDGRRGSCTPHARAPAGPAPTRSPSRRAGAS